MSEIIITRNFLPPNKSKVEQAIEYYRKNGELEKAIYVTLKNDKYVLEDKYLMYYVAKKPTFCMLIIVMVCLYYLMLMVHRRHGRDIDVNEKIS